MSDTWDNNQPLGIRTKIGLRFLIMCFEILAPYQFAHKFEAELKELKAEIMKTKE